jgi:hypothetical protein
MPIEGSSDDEAEESNNEYGAETNSPSAAAYPNSSYVYLAKRRQYGLVKSKRSDTHYLLKVRSKQTNELQKVSSTLASSATKEAELEYSEIEIDTAEEDVRTEVDLAIRVVASEEKRFTLNIKRPANDKLKTLAEDVGLLVGLTKYSLTFFYKGDQLRLNERLGDREIGGIFDNDS